jgi:N-acyl homoserine lactone hydrolase
VAPFPESTVLIQGAEYDWAMTQPTRPAFAATQKFQKLAGAHDVFGDGSVTVLREQTLASLDRIARVLDERKAQLWINHDKSQSAGLRYAPGYYE